jgi:predicted RNase H-like HicB family nuclease
MSTGRKISLIEEDDGGWSAIDEETGVASCGDTRQEALQMLDEAVALHNGEAGESVDTPDEERAVLREMGIDPDEVESAREENTELPEFMQ